MSNPYANFERTRTSEDGTVITTRSSTKSNGNILRTVTITSPDGSTTVTKQELKEVDGILTKVGDPVITTTSSNTRTREAEITENPSASQTEPGGFNGGRNAAAAAGPYEQIESEEEAKARDTALGLVYRSASPAEETRPATAASPAAQETATREEIKGAEKTDSKVPFLSSLEETFKPFSNLTSSKESQPPPADQTQGPSPGLNASEAWETDPVTGITTVIKTKTDDAGNGEEKISKYDFDKSLEPISVQVRALNAEVPKPASIAESSQIPPIESEPKPDGRRQRAYIPTYYSGTQAQIFFEDVLIDEVTQFQYAVVTNRTPIYGYSSELFDTVARGNKIVQGSFTINFVEANYIPIIAHAIKDQAFGRGAIGRREVTDIHKTIPVPFTPFGAADVVTGQTLATNSILSSDSFLAKQAMNQVQSLGNKEFRELSKTMMSNRLQADGTFNRINAINGKSISSTFENVPRFDIYAVFGDYTDQDSDHTVRVIRSVYLLGQGQTVIANGEPVAETYNFIARYIE